MTQRTAKIDQDGALVTGDKEAATSTTKMSEKGLSEKPTCSCGHTKGHFMVSAKASYDFWGWFILSMGVRATPIEIKYQCRQCGTILGRTRKMEIREQHR